MPSLYGSAGGANRKLRELYARDSGGTTRKLRELWGRDAGGTNRKIFSGYDCQASIGDYSGIKWSAVNADGSGKLAVYSYFYDDDPKPYHTTIDFYFDQPLSWSNGSRVLDLVGTYSFVGTVPQSQNRTTQWLEVINGETDAIIAQIDNYTSGPYVYPPYHINAMSAGTSKHFRLYYEAMLKSTSSQDAWSEISWTSGGLSICSKQINSVELI